MPRISAFYGIVISINWSDHPPPHFHATYAEYEVKVHIRTREVLAGYLPPRALRLVRNWAGLHRDELLELWTRARSDPRQPLSRIDPLP